MRSLMSVVLGTAVVSLCLVAQAFSAPDTYKGDTSIYGVSGELKPNLLILLDNSGSMAQGPGISGGAYDPAQTYATTANTCAASSGGTINTTCDRDTIYTYTINSGNDTGKSIAASAAAAVTLSSSSLTTSCNGRNPKNELETTGQYILTSNTRRLTASGACAGTNSTNGIKYATGNYINYINTTGAPTLKSEIAVRVLKNIINDNYKNIKIGLMTFYKSGTAGVTGGGQLNSVSYSGATYVTAVNKLEDGFPTSTSTTTKKDALLAAVDAVSFSGGVGTLDGQMMLEAGRYFGNCDKSGANCGKPAFGSTIGVSGGVYSPSPIDATCQKNYVILITDGMSTDDGNTTANTTLMSSICPTSSCAPDGCSSSTSCSNFPTGNHGTGINNSTSAVAKFLYDSPQNITTYTIGFGLDPTTGATDADALAMLQIAADSTHGRGKYITAGSEAALTKTLVNIVSEINEQNASFVAPVVPVSPDNRTYGSNRIYMGYFIPVEQSYWHGNIKKYGLDASNNIVGYNTSVPPFTSGSYSYWNTSGTPDADKGDKGGTGALLLTRSTARNIYTYTGTSSNLTDPSNAFSKANTALTSTGSDTTSTRTLNVASDAAKNDLIDFVHGYDTYNQGSGTTTKREWIMGDVLHSKPLVVNYASYPMTDTNESNCSVNKSIIYVGSNDGMLHAFKDCDGSEAWAFIPDKDILGNLKEIPSTTHTYSVDASASVYVYDANKDGNITDGTDMVILMVGLRRGGGLGSAPTKGAYYALNVTNPATPKYLWRRSTDDADFSEMGESWGEPKIAKLKIGSDTKIAAFISGGYDNMNEDSRFGATQSFTTPATVTTSTGGGKVTSTGSSATPPTPKGRGVYAVEIAKISSTGVPSLTNSGSRIWGAAYGTSTSYTASPATDSGMTFSIASDIATVDVNGDSYVDRLYVPDLGGNLWRFDVGNTNTASWSGYKIFSANPGSAGASDNGRKFFYKPVVSLKSTITSSGRGNDAMVFLGSGDREHPLNLPYVPASPATVPQTYTGPYPDRIYAIFDKGQTSAKSETNLVDVTTDQLQEANGSQATIDATVNGIMTSINSATNYGWYIRLNQNDGEKVLASPALANKILYVTTFTPESSASANSCQPNLGTSRLYALNYATGEAAMNFDPANDSTSTTNKHAKPKETGPVLLRSDRSKILGSGIAPSPVLVGDKAIVVKDSQPLPLTVAPGNIINFYWGQK